MRDLLAAGKLDAVQAENEWRVARRKWDAHKGKAEQRRAEALQPSDFKKAVDEVRDKAVDRNVDDGLDLDSPLLVGANGSNGSASDRFH